MWGRVALVFVLVATRVHGQAAIRYEAQDETKTATLDYSTDRDCVVYDWGAEHGDPPDLQYHVRHYVYGCVQKSFSYDQEDGEVPLTRAQFAELSKIAWSTDLSQFNRKDSTCLMGCLTLDANFHFFNNPLGDPVRDKLDRAVTAFVDRVVPSKIRKIVRFSCGSDLRPAQTVTFKELLLDPKRYDGQRVQVSGYYRAGDYESAFSAKPDDEAEDAIWLDDASTFADSSRIHWTEAGYLTIEGTFLKGPAGRWDEYAGEIQRLTDVVSFDVPSKPKPFSAQSTKR